MTELAIGESTTTTVPAADAHFKTGIQLRKTATYKFEAEPRDQTWKDGDRLKAFTADGRMLPWMALPQLFLRMPTVKWFALIGSIDEKRSTFFKIGTLLEPYSPPQDGELVCFANDAWGFNDFWYTHNNSGQITIRVTRTA